MKRLGIFAFYDAEGIAGKYVEYLLAEIRSVVDDLYIVSNCILSDNSKKIFSNYSNNVIERENKGFDGSAYKEVLYNVIGFDNCKKWDELLLVNDTFYGPFCCLAAVFEKMEQSQCDFWGLSIHGKRKENEEEILHKHVQSYFLVLRSNLFWSEKFSQFWIEMQEIDSYEAAINNFEIAFTYFFSQYGFIYDVLADTTSLEKRSQDNGINFTVNFPYQLMEEYGFPILKKKALMNHGLYQAEGLKILEYIKSNTDYDVQIIWEDLLRKNNIRDLIFKMNLLYLIDDKKEQESLKKEKEKIAVVFRIDSAIGLEDALQYTSQIHRIKNLYLWIEEADLFASLGRQYISLEIVYCENKEKSYLFWKKLSERFEIVGYIYLKASFSDDYYSNYLLINTVLGNLLKNEQYIYKIHRMMAREKALGMLLPPINRYGNCRYIWGEDAFWIKGKCLSAVCQNRMKEKTQWLPEMVAKQGYYSAIVETDDYSKSEVKRLYQIIYDNEQKSFFERSESSFHKFWNKYDKRYIYGIGKIAERVTYYLQQSRMNQYEGYVVTKREKAGQLFYGKHVWQLDELPDNEIGVIIAMNDKNIREVLPVLTAIKGVHCFILNGMEI